MIYPRAYHRFSVIPREVCLEEAWLIPFCDFIQWYIPRQIFNRICMLYVCLDKKVIITIFNMVVQQQTKNNKIKASGYTWPKSNAFCFSFGSTHWPIQIKTSPCVSSIIMSSGNRSSWEKLKISVTCRGSYKSHSLDCAI
jgi:hypothetical protein